MDVCRIQHKNYAWRLLTCSKNSVLWCKSVLMLWCDLLHLDSKQSGRQGYIPGRAPPFEHHITRGVPIHLALFITLLLLWSWGLALRTATCEELIKSENFADVLASIINNHLDFERMLLKRSWPYFISACPKNSFDFKSPIIIIIMIIIIIIIIISTIIIIIIIIDSLIHSFLHST